jgi:hypothetical protein
MPGQPDSINPARRFVTRDGADIDAMMRQSAEMRETLEQLHLGAIPSANFSPAALKRALSAQIDGWVTGAG